MKSQTSCISDDYVSSPDNVETDSLKVEHAVMIKEEPTQIDDVQGYSCASQE